jgi:hypothetical protein
MKTKREASKGKVNKIAIKNNLKTSLEQAPERLEKVKRFQKEMDNQLRINKELLTLQISL